MLVRKYNYIVFLLLIILFLGASLSSLHKSASYDEFGHLSRGVLYLKTGILFDTGHPPLANIIEGLPVILFLNPNLPDDYYALYLDNNFNLFARKWVYNQKYNLDTIFFFGRFPVILLSLLAGFFVFKWAKELYGIYAGLFSLFLYSLSPMILSNSWVVYTDMVNTVFTFISVYFFWRFIKSNSIKYLVFTSVFFGFAISSRLTALMLIPIFMLFLFIEFIKNLKKGSGYNIKKGLYLLTSFIIIIVIGFLFLNSFYLFRGSFTSLGDNIKNDNCNYVNHSRYNSETISNMMIPRKFSFLRQITKKVIEEVPIILPYPFLKDYWLTKAMASLSTHKTFINGRLIPGAVWYFYPEVFLITTPIPILILIIFSFFIYFSSNKKLEGLFLLIPISILAVYFIFFHPLQLSIRYLLPAYPFLFVFIGNTINLTFKNKLNKRIYLSIIFLLILWNIVNTVTIFPHYDSFFNEFVGQDNGYKYYVGFDVGQDLFSLKDYIKKYSIQDIKLSYSGIINPSYYINYTYLPSPILELIDDRYEIDCTPQQGVIAISVGNLMAYTKRPNCFDWLKAYKPIDKVGYTIFIYNIK